MRFQEYTPNCVQTDTSSSLEGRIYDSNRDRRDGFFSVPFKRYCSFVVVVYVEPVKREFTRITVYSVIFKSE